jgi:hypothetical protein
MGKVIIAAVAALAVAPVSALAAPVASADAPCGTMAQYGASGSNQSDACFNCIISHPGGGNAVGACTSDAPAGIGNAPAQPAAPANPPNDNCAVLLQPPNASVGAYNGCETANRATGR